MPEIHEYTPARLRSVTPYLSCVPPEAAIDWYRDVLDAALLGDPIVMPDGSIGHAELRIGDSVVFLAGEYEVEGVRSPVALGGNSVSLMIHVPDADATIERALAAGAEAVRAATDDHGAHTGVIRDPFGHRWFVATALEPDDTPVVDVAGRRYGDIGYVTMMVPDGDRAARFFGALLGWQVVPGSVPGGGHITSITPPAGILTHDGDPQARLYFRVDDLDAACERVRQLGGEVRSVGRSDSGGSAECVDDQGFRFDLWRARPGY